jgi:hypothetical protein
MSKMATTAANPAARRLMQLPLLLPIFTKSPAQYQKQCFWTLVYRSVERLSNEFTLFPNGWIPSPADKRQSNPQPLAGPSAEGSASC